MPPHGISTVSPCSLCTSMPSSERRSRSAASATSQGFMRVLAHCWHSGGFGWNADSALPQVHDEHVVTGSGRVVAVPAICSTVAPIRSALLSLSDEPTGSGLAWPPGSQTSGHDQPPVPAITVRVTSSRQLRPFRSQIRSQPKASSAAGHHHNQALLTRSWQPAVFAATLRVG